MIYERHVKTKTSMVEEAIEKFIDEGMTDKVKIFDSVEKEFNYKIPRPTIRRVARGLRMKIDEQIKTLENTKPINLSKKRKSS
jgi:hypothetical protein